jgi:hypothetical protein
MGQGQPQNKRHLMDWAPLMPLILRRDRLFDRYDALMPLLNSLLGKNADRRQATARTNEFAILLPTAIPQIRQKAC